MVKVLYFKFSECLLIVDKIPNHFFLFNYPKVVHAMTYVCSKAVIISYCILPCKREIFLHNHLKVSDF